MSLPDVPPMMGRSDKVLKSETANPPPLPPPPELTLVLAVALFFRERSGRRS